MHNNFTFADKIFGNFGTNISPTMWTNDTEAGNPPPVNVLLLGLITRARI